MIAAQGVKADDFHNFREHRESKKFKVMELEVLGEKSNNASYTK